MKLTTKLVLGGLFAFVPGMPTSAAQGYQGPWCAVFNIGAGVVQEKCDMATFEMCRHEAQFYGPTAFCRQNNWYAPYWGVGDARAPLRTKKCRSY